MPTFFRSFLIFLSMMIGLSSLHAAAKISVVVSILPQLEFVKSVGGDRVSVTAMVPAGASAEFYEPNAMMLTKLSKANLYVRLGQLPFEKKNMKVFYKMNPKMMIIDTSEGLSLKKMHDTTKYFDSETAHELTVFDDKDDGHGHSMSGVDPHTWLSPLLVKQHVESIYVALVKLDPASEAYFAANKNAYLAKLDELDAHIRRKLSSRDRSAFLVFHPTYGYFATTYGLQQISVEQEGKTPTAKQLKAIITYSRANKINVIFSQVQYPHRFSAAIAKSIGGTAVTVDPLNPHYIEEMKKLVMLLDGPLHR